MLLSKTVPFVKTVSTKAVSNVKLIKLMRDKLVWYHGVHAIMLIILTASADGPAKRKIPAHCVKKPGQQLRQPNNEELMKKSKNE